MSDAIYHGKSKTWQKINDKIEETKSNEADIQNILGSLNNQTLISLRRYRVCVLRREQLLNLHLDLGNETIRKIERNAQRKKYTSRPT